MEYYDRRWRFMGDQRIISISREYGTGGHRVAQKVAEDLDLPIYNRNILEEIAKEKEMKMDHLKKFDEKPRNYLLSRTVRGRTNSMEENLAQMQFEYLRKKADSGESFVVVGRCSETVLAGREGLVSVFVTGRRRNKLEHVMEVFGLSEEEAAARIERHDRYRRAYHNSHSDFKWGDSRNYDLCISVSALGIEGTAAMIEKYISLIG